MKNLWIALMVSVLAACQAPTARQGETFDRIGQELKDAAASKGRGANQDAAVGRAMLPPLQLESTAPETKLEPRFNLAVNNAPAGQVFMALVSGTPYSMLFTPELSGNLTLNLKNVTVREALETIRELYGYEFKIQGTRIMIQANTMQNRMFQINYLANRRVGTSEMRVTSSSPSISNSGGSTGTTPGATGGGTTGGATTGGTDSSRVRTSSDADFWKDLATALTSIVGTQDGRNVIVNQVSGVVLVKAMPSEIRAVEQYLKATQLMVERQVMLEAKIIDVALNDSYQTGINWAKFSGSDRRIAAGVLSPGSTLGGSSTGITSLIPGSTGNMSGTTAGTGVGVLPGKAGAIATSSLGKGFFGLAFQSNDFAALLSFLETQGDVQVLSSPRIATLNNQKALLKVGADDYFVTNISTSTTSSGTSSVTTPSITLQPFFSGIALDVTPQIDEDGNIILHVHPAVTVVEEKTKQVDLGSLGTFALPLASSSINETDSIVRVQDGNVVAIGGLMSQEQRMNREGLPVLSRAPGIGNLFGQKGTSNKKRELVILIKSTVIQNEQSWRQDLLDAQERIQTLDPRQRNSR